MKKNIASITCSIAAVASLISGCFPRQFNSSQVRSSDVSYTAEVKEFFSSVEKKLTPGFRFDWERIRTAVAGADAKIRALPPELVLEDQPLTILPSHIPQEFEPAFRVILDSQRNQGLGKIKRRIVIEQLVEQMVEQEKGAGGASCSLTADGKNPRSAALNSLLKDFVVYKYGRAPEPLPDAFLTAVPFYGHLVEKESPFLDIAFAPGGSMAHKSAHSVNVHVMDFFEAWLACGEEGSKCAGLNLKDLTIYIGMQGIVENLPSLKKDIEAHKKVIATSPGSEAAMKARRALDAAEADLARANRMLSKKTVRTLDWSKTEFQNGTALWDVFFDFQNLSDEAFKDFKNMRLKRKLKVEDYLALSIQTVANPFHMGKPELLKTLFPCSGWN